MDGSARVDTYSLRHELGHLIGLHHTHKRIDRDEHVQVHWRWVPYWPSDPARAVAWGALPTAPHIGPYDVRSVMHYRSGPADDPNRCTSISRLAASGPTPEDHCVNFTETDRWIVRPPALTFSEWDYVTISALYCDPRYNGGMSPRPDGCARGAVQANLARLREWERSAEGRAWAARYSLATRDTYRGSIGEARARCSNGVQDENERGVDCGGVCWFDCDLCETQRQVPRGECEGLRAVYNATRGDWEVPLLGQDVELCDGERVVCSERATTKAITELRLGHLGLEGYLPDEIGEMGHLEKLLLFGNRLEGPLPQRLGELAELQEIVAADNSLVGPIPSSLGNLPRLNKLILTNNELTGPIPESLYRAASMGALLVNDNAIEGTFSPSIANWTHLYQLEVRGTDMSGQLPDALMHVPGLQRERAIIRLGTTGCFTASSELAAWLDGRYTRFDERCVP